MAVIRSAWDLAADWDWMEHYRGFRVVGGRAIWTEAYTDGRPSVRLSRLEADGRYVKQFTRYVRDDTLVEMVRRPA